MKNTEGMFVNFCILWQIEMFPEAVLSRNEETELLPKEPRQQLENWALRLDDQVRRGRIKPPGEGSE